MKFIIILALISVFAASAYGQDLSCTELEKMGETGIRKMFVLEEGAKISKTAADIENRCNEGKKLYKTLLEYKKCLKPFPQQIFTTTSQSIGKLLKKKCGDEEGKKQALKMAQCVKEEHIKSAHQCAVGSLDAIQKLADSTDSKANLIPKMCCLAHVSADCIRNKISGITCEDPTINPKEHFEETMATLSKDAMDIACEDYKTMNACQAKIPDAVNELKSIVNNANAELGQRSLIQPLLKVAEKVAN